MLMVQRRGRIRAPRPGYTLLSPRLAAPLSCHNPIRHVLLPRSERARPRMHASTNARGMQRITAPRHAASVPIQLARPLQLTGAIVCTMEHVPLLAPLLQDLTARPNSLSVILIYQISNSMRDIRCMTAIRGAIFFNDKESGKRFWINERKSDVTK